MTADLHSVPTLAIRYRSWHNRLRVIKVPASDGVCTECGSTGALEHSYLGGCPDEQVDVAPDGGVRRFSLNPDSYVILCQRCHQVRDCIARAGACHAEDARRWLAAYTAAHGPVLVAWQVFEAATSSGEGWAQTNHLRVTLGAARRNLGIVTHRLHLGRGRGTWSTWVVPTNFVFEQRETGAA